MSESAFAPPAHNARLAVLISGGGRTLENLINASGTGSLPASIVAVISSRPGVRGLDIATNAGIPGLVIERRLYSENAHYSDAIYSALAPFQPDLIICAGFLKRLVVPEEWTDRILNIHPALIPESHVAGTGFYGLRVHQAVIESGANESGATVHIVDNEYDHGPVVMTQRVPVLPHDTAEILGARVFAVECELYPKAITEHLRVRAVDTSPVDAGR